MTSTSFNPIHLQRGAVQQNQPLALKQGQVFHGTVKKLYPDQMAEIQVGSTKLFAKLETPLKAGDAHFFQVVNNQAQTELKVVTGPMQPSQTLQLGQLLDSLNLPKTAEMQQIVGQFVKNQLPLTKENLLAAEGWLKNLPESITKQEALQAIQKMTEMKMPFIDDVFKGMLFGSKVNGISNAITNLGNQLAQDLTIEPSIKSNIMQQLQLISKPLAQETGGALLSNAANILSNPSAHMGQKAQLLELLKEANIVPKNTAVDNWQAQSFQQHKKAAAPKLQSGAIQTQPINTAQSVNPSASKVVQEVISAKTSELPQKISQLQTWISNQETLSSEQKTQLVQLVNRFEALPKNAATIELFAKQLHEQLIKAFSSQQPSQLTTAGTATSFSNSEQLLALFKPESGNMPAALADLAKTAGESTLPQVQQMAVKAEQQILEAMDGKRMEQALKTILKGLGLSYEAAMNNKMTDMEQLAQSLKPQLLSLLQDAQVSTAIREASENVLARLNGMQLTSGESGHQHQFVMQIPLQFLGKQTEATVQWNGRMKENGKIDSNYARVLFYLNMEALEETMIDMQVQNRIVTIHLYNDRPELELLAEPLKDSLKEGLLERDYQLSGLFVKAFEKTTVQHAAEIRNSGQNEPNNGVDIRI